MAYATAAQLDDVIRRVEALEMAALARESPAATTSTSSSMAYPPVPNTIGVVLDNPASETLSNVVVTMQLLYQSTGWTVQVLDHHTGIGRTTSAFVIYLVDSPTGSVMRDDRKYVTYQKGVTIYKKHLLIYYVRPKAYSVEPRNELIVQDGALVVDHSLLGKLTSWASPSGRMVNPEGVQLLPGLIQAAGIGDRPRVPQPSAEAVARQDAERLARLEAEADARTAARRAIPAQEPGLYRERTIGVVFDMPGSASLNRLLVRLNEINRTSGFLRMEQLTSSASIAGMNGNLVLYFVGVRTGLAEVSLRNVELTTQFESVKKDVDTLGKTMIVVPVIYQQFDPNLTGMTMMSLVLDQLGELVVDRRTLGLLAGWTRGKIPFNPPTQEIPIIARDTYLGGRG